MSELQILFQLERAYGKVMTLEQALDVLGRVVFTREVLEEEGREYDELELINEIGDCVFNEM